MQIAIVGTGGIGSTFALHLSKAGHAVTVIARNKRLAQLQAENAIVTVKGERAAVKVLPELDATTPYDLVLVSVLAHQVDSVMPALKASAAKTVMFMFNTFDSLAPLKDAVGAERFAFGFPAIYATLPEGKLSAKVIITSGQTTTVDDAKWAKVFTAAGIKTIVDDDMFSWLRSHAVVVAPIMSMSVAVHASGKGISWREASVFARGWAQGFRLVRALGNDVRPGPAVFMSRLPSIFVKLLLWVMSRTSIAREMGAIGPNEARALIDSMKKIAPDQTDAIALMRP